MKKNVGKILQRGMALLLAVAMITTSDMGTLQTVFAQDTVTEEPAQGVQDDTDTSSSENIVTEEETQPAQDSGQDVETQDPNIIQASESADNTDPTVETVRDAIDWTQDRESLSLSIERMIYTSLDAEGQPFDTNILCADQQLDLTGINTANMQGLQLTFGFDFLKSMGERGLQNGDVFTYTIPTDYFTLTDTVDPENVEVSTTNKDLYRADDPTANENNHVVGTYTIKENVITVTLNSTEDLNALEQLFGVITVPVTLKSEALSTEENATTHIVLQGDAKSEDVSQVRQSEVTFPKLPQPEVSEEPTAEETPDVDAGNEAVTEKQTETDAAETEVVENAASDKENNSAMDIVEEEPAQTFWGFLKSKVMSFFSLSAEDTKATGSKQVTLPLHGTNPMITADADSAVGDFGDTYYPFEEIIMTLPTNTDGYKNQDPYSFSFKFQLDSEYLFAYREALMETADYETWHAKPDNEEKDITEYITENKEKLKPITVSFDLGEEFLPQTGVNQTEVPISGKLVLGDGSTQSVTFAYYSVVKDEATGHYKVVVTTVNDIYEYNNVSGFFSANMQLNKDGASENDTFDVDWDDQGEVITVENHVDDNNPDDQKKDYDVTKTGPVSVNTAYIDYQLTATADATKTPALNLQGLTLEDTIPAGLEVFTLQLGEKALTEAATKEQRQDGEHYYQEDGKLKYYINNSEDEVTLDVRLCLNKDTYTAMLKGKNTWTQQFSNKASLTGEKIPDNSEDSDEVTTTMDVDFFTKEGTQNPIDGSKIDWTLKINTTGTSIANAYLVDRINANQLDYDFAKGILIADEQGKKDTIKDFDKLDSGVAYDSLTADSVASLTENGTKNVYYKDGTDWVMIIPYAAEYQNQIVTVKYSTILTEEAMKKADETGNATDRVTNDAAMFWKWGPGVGPGVNEFRFNIDKAVDTNYDILNKTAGNYDQKTQTMIWNINTRAFGTHVDIGDAVITDVISDKEAFAGLTYTKNGGMYRQDVQQGTNGDATPYYTLEGNTLEIHCGILGTTNFYNFQLKTTVTDVNFLASQGTETKLSNKASIATTINGVGKTVDATADKTITNTLIQKAVARDYDYNTHTIQWKITANPNNIKIQNEVISDTLPVDMTFATEDPDASITKITKIAKGNSLEEEITDWKDQFTFASGTKEVEGKERDSFTLTNTNIGDDDYTYCVYLDTKVKDEWLKVNEDGSFVNGAELTGKVVGENQVAVVNVDALADATAAVTSKVLSKTSEKTTDGRIKWTVLINAAQTDLTGLSVTEDFSDWAEYIELDQEAAHFGLYSVDISSYGTATIGALKEDSATLMADGATLTNMTETGFQFHIPTAYAEEALALVFYTYGLQDAQGGTIGNKVYLTDDITGTTVSNTKAENTLNSDYTVDAYGQLEGVPLIRVQKVSSNGSDIRLPGVEFTLKTFLYDENSQKFVCQTDSKTKTQVTGTNGRTVFCNLRKVDAAAGAKAIYCLEETTPKAGYETAPKQYFVFANSDIGTGTTYNLVDEKNQNASATISIGDENVSYSKVIPTTTYEYMDIKDVPTGTVSLRKVGPDGVTMVSGVAFKLTRDDGKWDEEHEKREATSNDVGLVTFINVDPGCYTMTETDAAKEYTLSSFKVEVKDDGSVQILRKSGDAVVKGTTIANAYIKGDIEFIKTDIDVASLKLSGATYGIYDGKDKACATELDSATSDANGKVKFTNITYCNSGYIIKETSAPIGYELKENCIVISAADLMYDIDLNKSFNVKLTNQEGAKDKRVKGGITFTKTDYNATPLPNRKFEFTYKDSDGFTAWKTDWNSDAGIHAAANAGTLSIEGEKYYVTTNANGVLVLEGIPYGNYELKEVCPDGDAFSPLTIPISRQDIVTSKTNSKLTDLGIQKDSLKKVSFSVTKTDNAGDNLRDIKFTLTGNNAIAGTNGSNLSYDKTTNADGKVTFSDISVNGNNSNNLNYYTLKEQKISRENTVDATTDGYETLKQYAIRINGDGQSTKVEYSEITDVDTFNPEIAAWKSLTGTALNLDVENTPVKGNITLTKKDQNGILMQGQQFTLYRIVNGKVISTATPAVTAPKTGTTVENGTISFTNVDYAEYLLVEDSMDGIASLASATTTMQDAANKSYTGIRISRGDLTITNTTMMPATETETFSKTLELTNNLNQTNVSFKKVDQNGNPLANITFKVQRKGGNRNGYTLATDSNAKYADYLVNGVVLTVTVPSDGVVTIKGLMMGEYQLVETNNTTVSNPIYGEKNQMVRFTIDKGGAVTILTVNAGTNTVEDWQKQDATKISDKNYDFGDVKNLQRYGFVNLKKVSSEDNNMALPDTEFTIYTKNDKDEYIPFTSAIKTDEQGNLIVNEDGSYGTTNKYLVYGTYYLKETQSLSTFVPDETYHEFTISEDSSSCGYLGTVWISTVDNTVTYMTDDTSHKPQVKTDNTKVYANTIIRNTVSLSKNGLVPTNATTGTATIDNLKGAKFAVCLSETNKIVAMLKNVSGENNYTLASAEEVTGFTTAVENDLRIPYLKTSDMSLLAGNYDIYEVAAPIGYVCPNNAVATMAITSNASNGIEMKVGGTTTTAITDTIKKADVKVQKLIELINNSELNVEHTPAKSDTGAAGFTFTITRTFESDGTTAKLFDYTATVTTGDNGVATFADVPVGTYQVEEISAPDHYLINEDTKIQTINVNNDGTVSYGIGKTAIEYADNLKRGSISGTKVDKTSTANMENKVKGATIGLFGDSACKGTPLLTTVTNKQGAYSFTNIPYGTYYIKETVAPFGYLLNATSQKVVISTTATTPIATAIENTMYTASLKLDKVDSVAKDQLKGVVFTLTGTNIYGESVTKTATTTNGNAYQLAEFTGLQIGNYTIEETTVPTGYTKAANLAVTVTGKADGVILNVDDKTQESGATITVENTPITGEITFTKVENGNENRKLAGVTFELYRGTTKVAMAESNAQGVVTFSNIPYGNYTVKEIAQDGVTVANTNAVVTITKGDTQYEIRGNTFTYNAGNVANTLAKGAISLTKKNQNGDTLSNITFKLQRRQSADGGMVVNVPAGVSTYEDFEGLTAKTNEGGRLSLTNIPYGDYKLVEQQDENVRLHENADLAEVYFTVKADGSTVITKGATNNVVANNWEYGSIDLEKTFDHVTSATNRPEVTFCVYQDAVADGQAYDKSTDMLYMTLKTNGSGKLIKNVTNGAYRDFSNSADGTDKWLLAGHYFIEEMSYTGDQYFTKDNVIHAITVTDGKAAMPEGTKGTINNAPIRAKVNLTKTGSAIVGDDTVNVTTLVPDLSGARFAVCLSGSKSIVAMLINTTGKKYTLESAETITNFVKKTENSFGVPYLDEESGLLAGNYDIYEIQAPLGYILPTDKVATMTIDAAGAVTKGNAGVDNTVTNTIRTNSVSVKKYVELADDSALNTVHDAVESTTLAGGFTFTLKRTAEADGTASTFAYERTIQTAADGTATFNKVPVGTYEITESASITNYELSEQKQVVVVENDGNVTYPNGKSTVEFSDALSRGNINGTKIDTISTAAQSYAVEGSTIGLFKNAEATGNALLTATTDKNGAYSFKNIPYGTYYLKEIAAPAGYELNETSIKEVTVSAANITADAEAIEDTMYLGKLDVDKIDSITKAVLKGAEFTLSGTDVRGIEFKQTVSTTAANGTTYQMPQFTNIPMGSYTVEETKIPDGYQKAESFNVTVTGTNGGVSVKVDDTEITADEKYTVEEVINKGKITFTKYGTNSETDLKASAVLGGAIFGIYTNAACEVPASSEIGKDEVKRATATSAADGTVTFEDVRPGTYYIKETSAPDNFTADTKVYSAVIRDDGTFDGIYDGITKTDKVTNEAVRGSITLTKVDATDATKKLKDVEFKIYRKGETEAFDTQISDANGVVTFNNLLMDQAYTVKETATLNTYVLSATEETRTLTNNEAGKAIDLGNWSNAPTSFSFQKVQTTGEALAGAVFGLYDDGKLIQTATSQEDGSVTFTYFEKSRTYTVKEESAPEGYFTNKTEFQLIVDANGTGTLKNNDATVTEVVNDDMGSITLNKTDAIDGKVLEGAVFELKNANGEVVDTQTTGKDGQLVFAILPMGAYTITEKQAPKGYQNSSDETKVTLIKGATTQNITIERTNHKADFSFNKTVRYFEDCYKPNNTMPLAGAQFELASDAALTNVIATGVSNERGEVTFNNIPTGSWHMRETNVTGKNSKRIRMSDQDYIVVVEENGTVTIDQMNASNTTVVNDVYRGNISILKVNEDNHDAPIANSTYGLYRAATDAEVIAAVIDKADVTSGTKARTFSMMSREATNISLMNDAKSQFEIGSVQDGMVLVATATTGADGMLNFDGVLTGVKYVIRELVAPNGSEVSENPITLEFEVNEDGKAVINPDTFDDGTGTAGIDKDGNITWYEPDTKAMFYKKDEAGNLLAGAKLIILNEDGTSVEGIEPWISSAAEGHLIQGILVGGKTYILKEISAPDGYEVAQPITFTMSDKAVGPNEKYVQEWTMVDKKTPMTSTPTTSLTNAAKTGDNMNVIPFIILAFAAFAVIVMIIVRKKKKK